MRNLAEDLLPRRARQGRVRVRLLSRTSARHLWEISGHLGLVPGEYVRTHGDRWAAYYLKPMNCPFHIQIYQEPNPSYRDLPMRFAEWGTVYRYERSGVLHGLLRVRGFTQDDAHLFCRPDQMAEEIDRVLEFSLNILRAFGFKEFQAYLSTRNPEKAVGSPEMWEAPTEALRASSETRRGPLPDRRG